MKKLILTLLLSISLFTNAQTDSTKVDNFQKTDKALSEVVKKALSIAEKTGDFVIEQAPLLVQEFYTWHVTKSILTLITWGIILTIFCVSLRKIKRHGQNNNLDMLDYEYFFPTLFCYGGILVSTIIIIEYIYNLVFMLVAPKLYLIEYFVK